MWPCGPTATRETFRPSGCPRQESNLDFELRTLAWSPFHHGDGVECRMMKAECRVRRRAALPSAFCLLPSAFCLLPSAFCLLPSAFCLLPSAFCLLPSALHSAFIILHSAFPSHCPRQDSNPELDVRSVV